MSKVVALMFGSLMVSSVALAADTPPTFYKDVLPILQSNCQTCHRPGEVAPMSLISYEDARPWARSIKTKTVAKQMPPWFADPDYGLFSNERKLSSREIETLSAWADAGAPAGNPKDAPPAKHFENGWNIKPDVVVEMHYTTNGKPTSDVSRLGLVLAKEDPAKRYYFHAGPTANNLVIPAGDGNAEVVSEVTLAAPGRLVYAQPHMHLRGKDFELQVIEPGQEKKTVLKGKFDFEWQMGYQFAEAVPLPAGT